jgi:hypothetical protein
MMPEHAPAWSSNDSAPRVAAIETSYKGYRFRSRLEARWAVFFDSLGVKWEYEPEGFEFPGGDRYLPDFRLPNGAYAGHDDLWVEVKGRYDKDGFHRLVNAARHLPVAAEGKPDIRAYQPKLLLLGDIPDNCCAATHPRIGLSAAGMVLQYVFFGATCDGDGGDFTTRPINDALLIPEDADNAWYVFSPWLEQSTYEQEITLSQQVTDAYVAARSARFEHGESGAPVR